MGKNRQILWVVLIAIVQVGVFALAPLAMSDGTNQQQSASFPQWWNGLLLLVGVGGVGLLMFMLLRVDKNVRRNNLELEKQVSATTEALHRTQTAVIFGLAKLSESRDTDTGEHLDRIRKYVTILAQDLSSKYPQLDETTISDFGLASSLHDIGKVGIPDSILLKPGLLSPGERKIMEKHTAIGGECLEAIQTRLGESDFLEMACQIAWSHHERWDGSGYPHQLSGQAIPLVARIMALADVYDALTSKRPYKKARSHSESRQILLEGKGTQFDPEIVDAFIRHESEFEAISVTQKDIADEDCVTGLQRIAEAAEALQSSTTNLIHPIMPTQAVNSKPIA